MRVLAGLTEVAVGPGSGSRSRFRFSDSVQQSRRNEAYLVNLMRVSNLMNRAEQMVVKYQ